MYFLRAALSGMKRRVMASLLTIVGGAALLTAAAAIGLWSFWLGWDQKNVEASRTAAVFVDTTDTNVIEEAKRKIAVISGVEKVRVVSAEEFSHFLQEHFPDLFDTLQGLDTDVFPRTLEVTLPGVAALDLHRQAVEQIAKVPSVARVDDALANLKQAFSSLHWLSLGGVALGAGLWFVLLILCLGHYQNILYTDSQEILLIRSLGATKMGILLPWLLEALMQTLIGSTFAVLALGLGRNLLVDVYNQFFGTLGFEPFQLDMLLMVKVAAGIFLAGLLAHSIGGVCALFRGKIA